MSVTTDSAMLSHFQDLFYRCKFNELLAEIERQEASLNDADGEALPAELALLKSNTLFEQHKVGPAKSVLKSVSQRQDTFDPAYLYALARLCYFDSKQQEARSIFQEILTRADDHHYRFKALLGVANTHYSEGDYAVLPKLIGELQAFEPLPRDDERISLMIFLGNYYFASGTSSQLAKHYFKKALSAAAAKTWTYFITRSLWGIASICEKEGQANELMWTLDILQAFVDQSEQRFFSYLINNSFKTHFAISTPMEFDTANRRIMIESSWLAFHDRPLLFQFLLLLHNRGGFVEKEAIARDLWPGEPYKPRQHDPRIFDIAKRARHLIEAYENQPVVLLSGRMGYKLASM